MSGLLAGKVWQSNLHPDLKPLAAALADIANDDGTRIFPSVAYMCWLLGRSERAIQIQLARLKDPHLGVLQTVREGGGIRGKNRNGRVIGWSTEYRLVEENLPQRPPWKELAKQKHQKKKGAITAGFQDPQNGAVCDEKGCILPQKTVLSTAPYPSLEPLVEEPSGTATPTPQQPHPIMNVEETRRQIEARAEANRLRREVPNDRPRTNFERTAQVTRDAVQTVLGLYRKVDERVRPCLPAADDRSDGLGLHRDAEGSKRG